MFGCLREIFLCLIGTAFSYFGEDRPCRCFFKAAFCVTFVFCYFGVTRWDFCQCKCDILAFFKKILQILMKGSENTVVTAKISKNSKNVAQRIGVIYFWLISSCKCNAMLYIQNSQTDLRHFCQTIHHKINWIFNKALFSGWRYCFHGHFCEIRGKDILINYFDFVNLLH